MTAVINGREVPACIGCGYCCSKTPCPFGATRYGAGAPCGGLVERDGRHWCRAVLEAKGEKRQWLKRNLYIGEGCCSPLNSRRGALLAARLCSSSSAEL
ncbi:MAG: hypothetical protein JRD89_09130 [Deltaproteobacteria bacterium]|nr:hypothetical protein [Deltaproteobacteria bacterium]